MNGITLNKISHVCIATILIFLICLFIGCGDENSDDDSSKPNKVGSAKISWSLDCKNIEIASVVCQIYDESNTFLVYGGPWNCENGSATISNIPIGEDRKFVLLVEEGSEGVVYRGEKNNISVKEQETINIGIINMESFVVNLISPESDITFPSTPFLDWDYVNKAARYEVSISDDKSFNPIIEIQTISGPPYKPKNLTLTTEYFWKVKCIDIFENDGVNSLSRIFTIRGPVTDIISPTNLEEFNTYDYIDFDGIGYDYTQGDIASQSFTWVSSIDGYLGTGDKIGESNLSIGIHTITLSVENTDKIIGMDTIEIIINEVEE
jgi:hypothetical protein